MPVPRRALLALAALLGACASDEPMRRAGEVTVQLHTDAESRPGDWRSAGELGVSTDYGVVFLGQGQRSGEVDFTVWFEDGPSPESGIVEPLGGGLYVTRPEVRVPTVPITFDEPAPGTEVWVVGRDRRGTWMLEAKVGTDERVEGLLLREDSDLARLGESATGAGVYVRDEDGDLALLGLVAGRLELAGGRSFVTVVGPRDLWRLVAHPRDVLRDRATTPRAEVGP